jgi:hypothetical protein
MELLNEIVPNEIVPNEIVPNEIVPNEIVPNEIVPNEIVPNALSQADQTSILDFLVNPMYQNNIKKQKELKKDNSADIKFYRKRIISLCKDMLKDRFESEELKKIHDNYVNEIISYFKMKDTNDILQSQYISIIDEVKEEQAKEEQAKQVQEVLVKPIQAKQVQDTLNKNIMRKKITSTLDNYVTIVKKDEELPAYPVKKEINLKTSSLKNKGVRINK